MSETTFYITAVGAIATGLSAICAAVAIQVALNAIRNTFNIHLREQRFERETLDRVRREEAFQADASALHSLEACALSLRYLKLMSEVVLQRMAHQGYARTFKAQLNLVTYNSTITHELSDPSLPLEVRELSVKTSFLLQQTLKQFDYIHESQVARDSGVLLLADLQCLSHQLREMAPDRVEILRSVCRVGGLRISNGNGERYLKERAAEVVDSTNAIFDLSLFRFNPNTDS